MANIAKLKAKLTLETDDYMQSAQKVVRTTSEMGSQVEKIGDKIGKSYMKAIQSSVMSAFSAQAIDGMMRNLSKALDEFDPKGMRNFESVLGSVSDQIGEIVKQIPLIGSAAQLGQSIFYRGYEMLTGSKAEYDPSRERDRQKDLEEKKKFTADQKTGLDAIRDLEYQTQLLRAASDEERKRLQIEHEREQVMEKLNSLAGGPQRDRMKAELEDRFKMLQAAKEEAEVRKKAEAEAKKKADEERKLQEDGKKFMEDMEKSLRDQTMTERERFEYRLQELKLSEADAARAREIYDQTHQKQIAGSIGGASAVAGVSSAVGNIRLAGSVDYSQQRMASSLDVIKAATTKTSDLTQRLLETQRVA